MRRHNSEDGCVECMTDSRGDGGWTAEKYRDGLRYSVYMCVCVHVSVVATVR